MLSVFDKMNKLKYHFGNGKIKGFEVRIVGTSILFARMAPSDFNLFPNLKKFAGKGLGQMKR